MGGRGFATSSTYEGAMMGSGRALALAMGLAAVTGALVGVLDPATARALGAERDLPAYDHDVATPVISVDRPVAAVGAAPQVAPLTSGNPYRRGVATDTTGVDCTVVACVALTFDDGPEPDTYRLLDMLAAEQVPATFFVTGHRVARYPEIVAAEVAAGHQVANHTRNHPQLPRMTPEQVRDQLAGTQTAIQDAGGGTPTLMRPPYGAHDARTDAVSAELGLSVVLWDVDTLDWKTRNADQTVAAVTAQARPGSIVLMHDIHPTSVDAEPRVVAALRAKGLTPVTVSDLLDARQPKPGQTYTAGPRAGSKTGS